METTDPALWKGVALLLFLGFWLAILVRLIRARGSDFEAAAAIPLDDNRVVTPRDAGGNDD